MPIAKLTEKDIKDLIKAGKSNNHIHTIYKVGTSRIKRIRNGINIHKRPTHQTKNLPKNLPKNRIPFVNYGIAPKGQASEWRIGFTLIRLNVNIYLF